MYHVLLAIDENVEQAINQAETVADLRGDPASIKVTVAYAFSFKAEDDDLRDLESVQEVTTFLDDRGIEYDLVDGEAEPATFVISTAESRDVDLICVGGRKTSPTGKVLFGSVSQQIILNAELPVLVA